MMRKSNKLRTGIYWTAGLAIFAVNVLLSQMVPPAHAQFIDRIVRPCQGSSARGTVQVTQTDILINPCPGGQVTINGVPIVAGGGGDVFGPVSATDNAAARFNLATGKLIQNSVFIIADNGDVTTPGSVTTGNAGGVNGALDLSGLTSGTVTVTVANAAGTWTLTLPTTDGNPGEFLQTNGSGVSTWAAASGSGVTCAGCTANVLPRTTGVGTLGDSVASWDGSIFGIDVTGALKEIDLGDVNAVANGTLVNISDAAKTISLSALTVVNVTTPVLALSGEITTPKAIRTGTASNTDVAGKLTVGAGGTITYTFTQTYATAPICVSSDTDAVPLITGASASTTVLTVTGNVGHVVNYQCIGLN